MSDDGKDFAELLKTEFDRIISLKERLDNKTNNIITMGGTVATIFMGFGVFLITYVTQSNLCFLIPAIIAFFVEIIFTTISIRHAMIAYKLKEYSYPIDYKQFFEENGSKIKEQFKTAKPPKFNNFLIDQYIDCNRDNDDNNTAKSQEIGKSQKYLLFALIVIPMFAFLVILAKYVPCPSC